MLFRSHVIKKLSHSLPPEDDDDDDDYSDDNLDGNQEPEKVKDLIAQCRKIVINIRSSGQRREKFETWIKIGKSCLLLTHLLSTDLEAGNDNGWFKVNTKVITLPHKQLLRDIHTCWDSTYLMLRRFIEMHPVNFFLSNLVKSADILHLTSHQFLYKKPRV